MNRILENILVSVIIIFLSMHLFTVHSKLLFHLNPDKIINELNYTFDLTLFNKGYRVSTISALAYSIITAFILTIFVKYKKVFLISVFSFGMLDGIGVLIYYNIGIKDELFVMLGSWYYAIYTFFMIVSLGYFRHLEYKEGKLYKRIENAYAETDIMQLREYLNKIANEENKEDKEENANPNSKILLLYKTGKYNQQQIAEKVGVSQSKVSRTISKYNDDERS